MYVFFSAFIHDFAFTHRWHSEQSSVQTMSHLFFWMMSQFKTGACSPRGSCDFESGECTWVNVANGVTDGRDWIHADGHYRGPLVDYTTHTADGESLLLYLLCLLILQAIFHKSNYISGQLIRHNT